MNREEILKNLLLIGDKAEFIEELLRTESSDKLRLEADADEECAICHEMYSSPTSAEYKIQLPCCGRHTMGSKCIETWLSKQNTCPLCRQEFFPANQNDGDHYILGEDGTLYELDEFGNEIVVGRDDGIITDGYDQEALDFDRCYTRQFIYQHCRDLGLRAPGDLVLRTALELAQRVCYYRVAMDNPTPVDLYNLAAACVYMASHIICQPLTMDDITSGIDAGDAIVLTEATLVEAYQYLGEATWEYCIVDEELVALLGVDSIGEVLRRAPRLPISMSSPEHEAYERRILEFVATGDRGWVFGNHSAHP